MLTQVDVFGAQPGLTQLSLPLYRAGSSPIQIKSIEGLGPVKAAIASTPYGIIDGEAITARTVGKRNIVMQLGLSPDWATQTITELRRQLYQYFMPKADVTLQFQSNDFPTVQIDGVVEDLVPNMFSKDPEMQVSIICGRPDFVSIEQTVVNGVVVDTGGGAQDIYYEGTTPTGVNLKVESSDAQGAYTGELWLQFDSIFLQSFLLDVVSIDQNNYFELNSVVGNKYVRSVPVADPSSYSNLLNHVTDTSIWPTLLPGTNEFSVTAAYPGQTWEMTYFARYGGL